MWSLKHDPLSPNVLVATSLQLNVVLQKPTHLWEMPNVELIWGQLWVLLPIRRSKFGLAVHDCLSKKLHAELYRWIQVALWLQPVAAWL